jgi:tripartite-type tricarboxylate transporter receptor subunit TctC
MSGDSRAFARARRAVVTGGLAAALCAAAAIGSACAQDYPNRTVKIVVPYGPGGPSDVMSRLFGKHMQEATKQPVVVENRAGAGSALGARVVATSDPDGYTLLMGNTSTWAVAPHLMKNPGYDPIKSFVPIAKIGEGSTVVIVHPDLPVKSLKELVDYAKANPGKVSFGSAGVGNTAHIVGEVLKARAGIDMVHVPYRSGAEMTQAVVAGQVQIAFIDLSNAVSLIAAGKVRPIAVGIPQRSPDLPDMPTMIESGFPGFVNRNWTGLAAPAGTPPAVIAKINAIASDFLKSPETVAAMAKFATRGQPNSPEEFAALINSEVPHWAEYLKIANVKVAE